MTRLRIRQYVLLVAGALLLTWCALGSDPGTREVLREAGWSLRHLKAHGDPQPDLQQTDLYEEWLQRATNGLSRYDIKNKEQEGDSELYQRWLQKKLGRNNNEDYKEEDYTYDYKEKDYTGDHKEHFKEEVYKEENWNDLGSVEYDEGEEKSEVARRLGERKTKLREACSQLSVATSTSDDVIRVLKKLYLFYDYKTSVCTMGKVGSSTWVAHLTRVNGLGHRQPMLSDPRRQAYLDLPPAHLAHTAFATTRVITVRNPLTRLVSCFNSKYNYGEVMRPYSPRKEKAFLKKHFALDWATQFFTYWMPALVTNAMLPPDLHLTLNLTRPIDPAVKYDTWVYQQVYKQVRPKLSFAQFLRHVVTSHRQGTANKHWNTYYDTCRPCELQYSYVVRVETMTEDLQYLFTKLGIPGDSSLVKNKSHWKPSKYFKYYQGVPRALRREVYEVFRRDMDMFGYSLPKKFL